MNKIYHFILFCFATLCLAACSDDDPEVSGIDGKDHFISEFALTVDGITYQAMIVGDFPIQSNIVKFRYMLKMLLKPQL